MILKLCETAPKYIAPYIKEKRYSKGEHIIFEGIADSNVYVIVSGTVEIATYFEDGRQFSVWTQTRDTMFGEVELYNNEIPTFNVATLTETIVYKIPKIKFIDWMNSDPILLKYTYTQLVDKLLQSAQRQVTFISKPLKERIISVLDSRSDSGTLHLLTKKQLCIEVSAPIRSVNRVLEGINEYEYKTKKFAITKKDA